MTMEPTEHENTALREQKRLGGIMQWLAWLVFLALGLYYFSEVLGFQNNPNKAPATQRTAQGELEVVLQRNHHGHYVAGGRINGQPVTFFVDTGATGVALPDKVARKLGLRRGRPFKTYTANGSATSYAVSLDSVSIGGIERRDVSALIVPGLKGDEVLLGMSFLKHIEFTQRGDTLILRQVQR